MAENIAFGPRTAGWSRAKVRIEVAQMLYLVDLMAHAHKKSHEINSGQKQRVVIARVLINKPNVLLLSEPQATLDLRLHQRR